MPHRGRELKSLALGCWELNTSLLQPGQCHGAHEDFLALLNHAGESPGSSQASFLKLYCFGVKGKGGWPSIAESRDIAESGGQDGPSGS